MVETLISEKNPLLKDVRRLAAGGAPAEDGLALAEGPRLLEEALRSSIEIGAVILAESVSGIPHEDRLKGVRVARVPDAMFQKLASTESPQGVLALVRLRTWKPQDLMKATALIAVLDGVQDPGNAGTILRTAEAFGATGAIFLKGSVSPFNPKCLRASAGSAFRLPLLSGFAVESLLAMQASSKSGLTLYAADARAELALGKAPLSGPCAIIIGSEGSGVQPKLAARATGLKIPTTTVESLNAAIAAGILLYEARRQRTT
ncbi:MAG TPA: RNA methyltransferase [Bryobacteraceae bacterium]